LRSTFHSLRIRNYRLFLLGQVISVSGTWIQRVAQDWLVLDLTHNSGTALGLVSGLQFLPVLLFSVSGGLIADRYPKRRVLMLTQALMGLTALSLATLTYLDSITVIAVCILAFSLGVATAIDNPTRQSFVVELVGRNSLPNAVGLNSATFNISRMVGPSIGGLLLALLGPAPSFLVNAMSYGAVMVALAFMRPDQLFPEPPAPRRPKQVREGLHYVYADRQLRTIIGLVFVVGAIATNWPVMLALMARLVYHTGAQGYGALFTTLAAGSIIGALLSASRARPRMRYLVGAALAFGVLDIVAAAMPNYIAFLLALAPIGVVALTFNTSANSSVQLLASPQMRGRVMSVYLIANGGGSAMGGPLQGWIAQVFGARATFVFAGAAMLVAGSVAVIVLRRAESRRPPLIAQSRTQGPVRR
jgi:MFS family permease